MSLVKSSKRIRSPNFTEKEKRLLLKLVFEQRTILENRDTSAAAQFKKKQAWLEVTAHFNRMSPVGTIRNVNSIRSLYDNLKNRFRRREKIRQNGALNNLKSAANPNVKIEIKDNSAINGETISITSDSSDISRRADIDFPTNLDEEEDEADTKIIIVTANDTNGSTNIQTDNFINGLNSFTNEANVNLVEDIGRSNLQAQQNSEVENCKRQRGPNYSENEKRFLLKLFASYRHIIDQKETTSAMNHKKEEAWQEIADQLNKHCKGGPFRSALSIRRLYDNCKRVKRKKPVEKSKTNNIITVCDLKQMDFIWRNNEGGDDNSTCFEEENHEKNETTLTTGSLDVDETSVTDSGICNLRIAKWAKIATVTPQWTNVSSPQEHQEPTIQIESLSAQDDFSVTVEYTNSVSNNDNNIPNQSIHQSSSNWRLKNCRRRRLQSSKTFSKKLQNAKLYLLRLKIASERRRAKDEMLRRKALKVDIALKEIYLEKLRQMSDVKDVPFPPPCFLPK